MAHSSASPLTCVFGPPLPLTCVSGLPQPPLTKVFGSLHYYQRTKVFGPIHFSLTCVFGLSLIPERVTSSILSTIPLTCVSGLPRITMDENFWSPPTIQCLTSLVGLLLHDSIDLRLWLVPCSRDRHIVAYSVDMV